MHANFQFGLVFSISKYKSQNHGNYFIHGNYFLLVISCWLGFASEDWVNHIQRLLQAARLWLRRPMWDKQQRPQISHTSVLLVVGADITHQCFISGGSPVFLSLFLSKSLVNECWRPLFLKNCLMNCVAPTYTVFCKGWPLTGMYVACFEGCLQGVFVSLLWSTSVSASGGQLTIQNKLGQTMVFHPMHNCTCPAHRSCDFRSKASMLGTPAFARTSTFVMDSL